MIEIRFHGRGGQGAQVACKVLADASFREGKEVQAFPFFGVERRGAPVTAYTKIDDRPIRVKSQIYEPDHVVVLDESLLKSVDVANGLKDGGFIVINTVKDPQDFRQRYPNARIATVDATGVAMSHGLGSKISPIVNTSILGALAKASGIVTIDSIQAAIREVTPRNKEENARASLDAYNNTRTWEDTNDPSGGN